MASDGLSAWEAEYNRKWAAMEDKDQAAKRAGKLLGRYVAHPYADGHAYYEVVEVREDRQQVTIQHLDIGDGWVLPAWGMTATVPAGIVASLIASRDGWAKIHDDAEAWWNARAVGETVHYDNGSGSYVRGEVVLRESDGQKMMRPTALLGDWRPYDLRADGYYVRQVRDGDLMKPHAANMVGYPTHLNSSRNHPATLPPLELPA